MPILKLILAIICVLLIFRVSGQTIYPPQRALEKNNKNLVNLRGKVINNVSEQRPYKSLPVDLYYNIPLSGGKRSWLLFQSTITDSDGFFYFKNVRPFDEFKLKVNKSKDFPFVINKLDKKKMYQDILIIY